MEDFMPAPVERLSPRRQRCLIEPAEFVGVAKAAVNSFSHRPCLSVTSEASTEADDGSTNDSECESTSVSSSVSFDDAFAYPAAVEIRNTFLEPLRTCDVQGPNFRSAPSRLETAAAWSSNVDDAPAQLQLDDSLSAGPSQTPLRTNWSSEVDEPSSLWPTIESLAAEQDARLAHVEQPPTTSSTRAAPLTLCLEAALGPPTAGSVPLPSVGSAGHLAGTCKPCAFLHTRGCAAGPACSFCHLCDTDERKKRRKQKVAALREARRASS